MTEAEFQSQILQIAKLYGWKIHHDRPAMSKDGRWATHVEGDAGFPDLVLVHQRFGTIYAELKSEKGKLSPAQIEWIDTLNAAGAEVHVWRPHNLDLIVQRLAGLSWASLLDLGTVS
jgi:hypothetical protein